MLRGMPILAVTSCPTDEVADRIARVLVEERLAACVTRIPGARSVYRWKGAIEEAEEVVCLIKTTEARLEQMKTRLASLHPYEVPELLVLPVTGGLSPYLAWIESTI